MLIVDCIQGTDEWRDIRLGIPTASNASKLLTSTGKASTQSKAYMHALAGERLLGVPTETYKNETMVRGNLLEEEIRQSFEFIMDLEVEQVGFILDDSKRWGISPDGIINGSQGLEIKAPLISTHIGYLDKGKLPSAYKAQVQMSLLVTGFEAWYFCSYFPGLMPLILRIERDEDFIFILKNALEEFCGKLDALTEKLRG